MVKKRIYWTRLNIGELVKKFALIVIVGVLMIPTSLAFKDAASWVMYVILGLIGLLALYVFYTFFVVFYYIADDELIIFYMYKTYHFELDKITKMEKVYARSDINNTFARSDVKIRMICKGKEVFVSPFDRDTFIKTIEQLKIEKRTKK